MKSTMVFKKIASFALALYLAGSIFPQKDSSLSFNTFSHYNLKNNLESLTNYQDEDIFNKNSENQIEKIFREKMEKESERMKNFYENFKYPDEISDILKHSRITGAEPEILMAIRLSENGDDEIAYGILPQGKMLKYYKNERGYTLNGKFREYKSIKEKQLSWAAATIKNYHEKYSENKEGHKDFISYLADKYAPINAENDPNNLNNHWEKNVRTFYEKFKDL